MQTIGMKKTLNLHKYSIKLTEFSKSKKIIIPVAFSLAGLFLGSVSAKGEGVVCSQIINYFTNVLMDVNTNPVACFAEYLIIPTVFYAVSFFAGLSAFGALVANAVPLIFGFITGTISFFLYSTYTLKGLAYCVILIFPYAVICMLSLVLSTGESMSMSEQIVQVLANSRRLKDYSFKNYCSSYLKIYAIILAASALKTLLEYLFGSLFFF